MKPRDSVGSRSGDPSAAHDYVGRRWTAAGHCQCGAHPAELQARRASASATRPFRFGRGGSTLSATRGLLANPAPPASPGGGCHATGDRRIALDRRYLAGAHGLPARPGRAPRGGGHAAARRRPPPAAGPRWPPASRSKPTSTSPCARTWRGCAGGARDRGRLPGAPPLARRRGHHQRAPAGGGGGTAAAGARRLRRSAGRHLYRRLVVDALHGRLAGVLDLPL